MEKPNRADRRKSKFGGGRAAEHGGWPTHQPNPVFEAEAETSAAEAQTSVTKSSGTSGPKVRSTNTTAPKVRSKGTTAASPDSEDSPAD
jgi:hypothetical protein